ncbi:period circadian protein isoform X2 [Cylas formicarius]|uniref:period circadian protein isoform X2 n=1 Tax=Cylas formicarius TaxID=197179 RepID=UPI002958D05A|nr:period circadian protein isoform X2 [Cylas formicarius]
MEFESSTTTTKNTINSDSGYPNSCSNSNSQRSAGSKSRHSGSNSSGSSGYGGAPNANGSDNLHQHPSKRNKDEDHIKKKLRASEVLPGDTLLDCLDSSAQLNLENVTSNEEPVSASQSVQILPEKFRAEEETTAQWNEEMQLTGDESHQNAPQEEYFSDPGSIQEPRQEEGFSCIISVQDGLVLYATTGLTSVLGFPKDTWLGKSFIDFVHPKDRETFSTHVVTSMALPYIDTQGKVQEVKNYLYVCLRRYNDPTSAAASENSVSYQAFHLTITIRYVADIPELKCENNGGMFLVVVAMPIYSSYQVPGERKKSSKFRMRHTAACKFTHVDPDVVTSFGFLPQDMLGKSIFDFCHPEDMPFLRGVYKSVIKTCQINGSIFRSKPYRFLVQNGCFATIETEWSTIVNPWSRRLEIVLSLNRVVKGPLNPDVFDAIEVNELRHIPERTIREGKLLREEILQMLKDEVIRPLEGSVFMRCKAVSNAMGSLMDEVTANSLRLASPKDLDSSISERDFVMLGEISPHHDWESSSETPPSYNQLNYNENIKRFFESNPKTAASDESNGQPSDAKNESVTKTMQQPNANQKCLSPVAKNAHTRSGSGALSSFESNTNLNTAPSTTNTSNDSYKPHLTVSVLVKHNEDMVKKMIKQRKVQKSYNKDRENKKNADKAERNCPSKAGVATTRTRGVKRSGPLSWEGSRDKISKNTGRNGTNKKVTQKIPGKTNHSTKKPKRDKKHPTVCKYQDSHQPFTLNVTSLKDSSEPGPNGTFNGHMVPFYYIPAFSAGPSARSDHSASRCQVQYVPGMFYNAFQSSSPVIYSALPVFPVPFSTSMSDQRHMNAMKQNADVSPNNGTNENVPQFGATSKPMTGYQFQRPGSEAMSVKAEPGSGMCSIASISLANKAFSESSRKETAIQSEFSFESPMVNRPDEGARPKELNSCSKINENKNQSPKPGSVTYRSKTVDESSSCYSSSFSSFLKTDTGSGSIDGSSQITEDKLSKGVNVPKKMKVHQGNAEPEWMQTVGKSADIIYRYQVAVKDLSEVLESDLTKLKLMEQPEMVRNQLNQLYVEMELQGLSKALTLECSSCSSNEGAPSTPAKGNKRRSFNFLTCEEDVFMSEISSNASHFVNEYQKASSDDNSSN